MAPIVAVFVISRTRLYREGIAAALHEHFHIAGTAADLPAALARLRRLAADVVLLDHAIPEGSNAVAALCEHARVLALAFSERETDVIRWAEAGAAGLIDHDASFDDLVDGIAAAAGRVARRRAAAGELTRREREVAALLEQGLSNKEIATRLTIEVATVKNHVHNVLEKLQVRRRGEVRARHRYL